MDYAETQRAAFAAEMHGDKVKALRLYRDAAAIFEAAYDRSPNDAVNRFGGTESVWRNIRRLQPASR